MRLLNTLFFALYQPSYNYFFLLLPISFLLPIMSFTQKPIINTVELLNEAKQNEKLEIRVDFDASYENPYDYNQIVVQGRFITPSGDTVLVDGFYLQPYAKPDLDRGTTTSDGPPEFRIRFAPPQSGTYELEAIVTNTTGSATSSPIVFTAQVGTGHATKGFVRTSTSSYLRFEDQSTFVPVGQNIAWYNSNAIVSYYEWLTKLAANGGNFFRLWQTHWGLGLEWLQSGYEGLMQYRQIRAFYTDWLLEFCAEKDVYVMYCLQHHGQVSTEVNPNWQENPYNAINGGPCENTWDFFADSTAIALTKNRYRYVVARWGYSRNIMAWELFNEVDWTDQFEQHRELVAEWHLEMADYLKTIDPNQHLVSTSYARDQYDEAVWSSDQIDFTQTHYYFETPNLERIIARGTQHHLQAFEKPTLNGEFGITHNGSNLSQKDPDGIHLHNGMWGAFFSGGLGSGMSWWWDQYMDPANLYYHFASLRERTDALNWAASGYRPTTVKVDGPGADLEISPNADWAGPTDDTVSIQVDGTIENLNFGLGRYLYGAQWNTQFRNPPLFIIETDQEREFSVLTGDGSSTSPQITLIMDGDTILSELGRKNQTYSALIPEGKHEIRVTNTGTDWITIQAYRISGLGPALDAYVILNESGTEAAGWILNAAYNHQTLLSGNRPEPRSGTTLRLDGFTDGEYYVRYYDCLNGDLMDAAPVTIEDGQALLFPPEILWDATFDITDQVVATEQPIVRALEQAHIYPNPITNGRGWLEVSLEQVTDLSLHLYSIDGKYLQQIGSDRLTSGFQQVPFDISAKLAAGTYLLQLRTDTGYSRTLPLIVAP